MNEENHTDGPKGLDPLAKSETNTPGNDNAGVGAAGVTDSKGNTVEAADVQEGDTFTDSEGVEFLCTGKDEKGMPICEVISESEEAANAKTETPDDGKTPEATDDGETAAVQPEVDDAKDAAQCEAKQILNDALEAIRELGCGCWVIIPEQLRHPSIVCNTIDLLGDADLRVKDIS